VPPGLLQPVCNFALIGNYPRFLKVLEPLVTKPSRDAWNLQSNILFHSTLLQVLPITGGTAASNSSVRIVQFVFSELEPQSDSAVQNLSSAENKARKSTYLIFWARYLEETSGSSQMELQERVPPSLVQQPLRWAVDYYLLLLVSPPYLL